MALLVNHPKRPVAIHVVPVQDLREHATAPRCWCKPDRETAEDESTPVYVHHSMDGRELVAQGEAKEVHFDAEAEKG